MPQNRSEASYVLHNVVPGFAQYGFPQAGDSENLKVVGDVRIQIGSQYKYPDLVYYASEIPVLVVENKKPGKSMEFAKNEAFSYTRNFPASGQYNPNSIRPKYFATTDGPHIHKFYKYFYEIDERGELIEDSKELPNILTYQELLQEYGITVSKPKLSPEIFKEVFYDLAAIYITTNEKRLTPNVIKNVVLQIYEFLRDKNNYVSRQPYISLDRHQDRQLSIRNILSSYDWDNSLGPDIASVFQAQILRSFQGVNLNQYLTPSEVVAFMVNLANLKSTDKVLDFECGSGSFIRAALESGVKIENILGIDIADLPYYIAKTQLALYLGSIGEGVERLPIILGNGLYDQGNDWDVVISNPAGGDKYDENKELNDLDHVLRHLESDLDLNGRPDQFSEYYFSIQQSLHSAKVGGRICLILPEGVFANSTNQLLRSYISKYCHVNAIMSLPRGIFYRGTTTKTVTSGSQRSNQKMSIILCTKIREVEVESGVTVDPERLNYDTFLASIDSADDLEDSLAFILKQYQYWDKNKNLNTTLGFTGKSPKAIIKKTPIKLLQEELLTQSKTSKKQPEKPKKDETSKVDESLVSLFEEK